MQVLGVQVCAITLSALVLFLCSRKRHQASWLSSRAGVPHPHQSCGSGRSLDRMHYFCDQAFAHGSLHLDSLSPWWILVVVCWKAALRKDSHSDWSRLLSLEQGAIRCHVGSAYVSRGAALLPAVEWQDGDVAPQGAVSLAPWMEAK